jgi:hypothetical protein
MAATEPIRLTPTGGRGRPTFVAAAIVALLVIGLVKPWGGSVPTAGSVAPSSPAGRASGAAGASPVASRVAASLAPHSNTSGPCYYGLAWRLYTTETSDVGPVNTWYGLLPVVADGPADPRIATVHIHSTTIGQLGYCSIHRPGARAALSTQVWRLIPGEAAQPLVLHPAGASASLDPAAGAIYAPPSPGSELVGPAGSVALSGPSSVWTAARYVFAVRLAPAPAALEWFAVDIA